MRLRSLSIWTPTASLATLAICALMQMAYSQTTPQSSPLKATDQKAAQKSTHKQAPAPPIRTNTGPSDASEQSNDSGTALRISLSPSTSTITLGSIYSMSADLENVTSKPIYIDLTSVRLTVHAILAPENRKCVWWYAAENNDAFKDNEKNFMLQPQDHVIEYFSLAETPGQTDPSCTVEGNFLYLYLANLGKRINFTPGAYVFSVSGYYNQGIPDATQPRPFGHSEKFQVGISQLAIVLFAAVGGILAYFLTSLKSDGEIPKFIDQVFNQSKRLFSTEGLRLLLSMIAKIVGAAMLSGIFAIVSARSSDIQFPIKISILDGWGAITIGFLAFFAGGKFIQLLTNWYNKPLATS